MTKHDKTALKIAVRLREQLENTRKQPSAIFRVRTEHVQQYIGQFQALQRKLALCREKGLTAVTKTLQGEMAYVIQSLIDNLQALETLADHKSEPLPSLRDILKELEQLEQEFGDWSFEARSRVLSVTIEPVTLEGMYLGPFEIQLDLNQLNAFDPARSIVIEALDPHPAGSDSGVTHPHVSSGKLCAGEASAAVSSALQAGRICDLFIMVRSVLTNYNPNSPYIRLDEWEGLPCHNCGYTTPDDERFWCECCGSSFCGDCFNYCRDCDTSLCSGCLRSCNICESDYCEDCLTDCDKCGETTCKNCLEDGLCENCKEEEDDDSREGKEQREKAAREVPAA